MRFQITNKLEIKVNREDGGAIKRVLDDAAVLYFTEVKGNIQLCSY
jgi:hypothetical protein